MIFQHTWEKVLSGEKTQTRRLVKSGQILRQVENPHGGYLPLAVVAKQAGRPTMREVYVIGKDYAIQPGRTKAAVARLRVMDIRREDVRCISDADVKAEGFEHLNAFLYVWCQMHDKQGYTEYFKGNNLKMTPFKFLATRPAERYQAWALTFEVAS